MNRTYEETFVHYILRDVWAEFVDFLLSYRVRDRVRNV